MATINLGSADQLAPGERRVVTVQGRSILVIRSEQGFYALFNSCPHKGADLSGGILTGAPMDHEPGALCYVKEHQILRCPWHGWEYDITTGRTLVDPEGVRVKTYPIHVEDGALILTVQADSATGPGGGSHA